MGTAVRVISQLSMIVAVYFGFIEDYTQGTFLMAFSCVTLLQAMDYEKEEGKNR